MKQQNERTWIWYFALFVVILTTAPYLLAYVRAGQAWVYSGFLFGVEDGHSYIAKMLGGAAGDWLFRTPYTAYPQRGFLSFFPYILLGKLTAPPGQHEQLVALFHLFRAAGCVLLAFATYDFLSLFLTERRWRRLGTALAMLGGGLGWLSVVGLLGLWSGGLPLDFYSPESFGFLSVYGLPHLAVARALLLWGLHDYLCYGRQPWDRRQVIKTALLWFGLGLFQPLTIVTAWAVIAAHLAVTGVLLLRSRSIPFPPLKGRDILQVALVLYGKEDEDRVWWQYFRRAFWTGVLSAPLVLYTFLLFQIDPFLHAWEGQNIISSPIFTHYLLAYGLILPLVFLGMKNIMHKPYDWGWLAGGWVLIFPLLVYVPHNLARRFPEGVWVAMIVLAMKWVESRGMTVQYWIPKASSLAFLSTLLLIAGATTSVLTPHEPLFLPPEKVEAFQFLSGSNDQPFPVVLASFSTSNALPAWTHVYLLTGHGPESMNGAEMRERVNRFYSETCSEAERRQLLDTFHVEYVVWGPDERALGDWKPADMRELSVVYDQNGYVIFRYNPIS